VAIAEARERALVPVLDDVDPGTEVCRRRSGGSAAGTRRSSVAGDRAGVLDCEARGLVEVRARFAVWRCVSRAVSVMSCTARAGANADARTSTLNSTAL
jgi:hypothetical protein